MVPVDVDKERVPMQAFRGGFGHGGPLRRLPLAAGEQERAAETLRRIRPFFLSESGQETFTRLQEEEASNQEDTKKSAGKADSLAGNLCGTLTSAGYLAWQVAGGYYLGALPGLFVLEHFFTRLLHESLETHKGHRQDTDGN